MDPNPSRYTAVQKQLNNIFYDFFSQITFVITYGKVHERATYKRILFVKSTINYIFSQKQINHVRITQPLCQQTILNVFQSFEQ